MHEATRAPSAEPRAQGPSERSEGALRCGGVGNGRAGPEVGSLACWSTDREGKLSTGGLRAWWEGGPPWSLFTCDPSPLIPNPHATKLF